MTRTKALRMFIKKFFNWESNKMTVSDVLLDAIENGSASGGGSNDNIIVAYYVDDENTGAKGIFYNDSGEQYIPSEDNAYKTMILYDQYMNGGYAFGYTQTTGVECSGVSYDNLIYITCDENGDCEHTATKIQVEDTQVETGQ